jgi:hypothetical protein
MHRHPGGHARIPGELVVGHAAEESEVDRDHGQGQGQGNQQPRPFIFAQKVTARETRKGQDQGVAHEQQVAGKLVAIPPALEQ